jgi:hypothetical protein
MAAVTPVSANRCVGSFKDGTPNIRLYCQKELDDQGDPVITCATWRKFRVQCPKLNQLCSTQSEAFLPAITVCIQKLF